MKVFSPRILDVLDNTLIEALDRDHAKLILKFWAKALEFEPSKIDTNPGILGNREEGDAYRFFGLKSGRFDRYSIPKGKNVRIVSLEEAWAILENLDKSSPLPHLLNHGQVKHPEYYNQHPSGIECITIIQHYDFCVGNAMKYLWRAGLKNSGQGIEDEIHDLEKSIEYIQFKLKHLKEQRNAQNITSKG